jgi:hypothetical protein
MQSTMDRTGKEFKAEKLGFTYTYQRDNVEDA